MEMMILQMIKMLTVMMAVKILMIIVGIAMKMMYDAELYGVFLMMIMLSMMTIVITTLKFEVHYISHHHHTYRSDSADDRAFG
jgi:hypothetical protein